MTDIATIDPAFQPELVASRSTRGRGTFAKTRWTELAVHYLHSPPVPSRPWLSIVIGRSNAAGERDTSKQFACASLDDALGYFQDTAPARAVAEEARAWLARHPELAIVRTAAPALLAPTSPAASDAEALKLLYGVDDPYPRGFIARIAADFGIGESTVRMSLKNGTPLKVSLASIAHALDMRLIGEDARG